MFGLIRMALGGLLFIIASCIIARTKLAQKRRYYVFLTILLVVLVSASAFFPLENSFFTFDSPESAFKYYTWGHKDIALVVEGECSDLVIANKDNSNTLLIIPKTTDGWKIGIGSDTKKIKKKISDNLIIYVYQYRDTHDYFVAISSTDGESLEIADAYGSIFLSTVDENSSLNKGFISYYTNIPEIGKKYWISINNEPILLWE